MGLPYDVSSKKEKKTKDKVKKIKLIRMQKKKKTHLPFFLIKTTKNYLFFLFQEKQL